MDEERMDQKITERWNDYVMFGGETEVLNFFKHYYQDRKGHLLFIIGKGFDPRMNNMLRLFLKTELSINLTCLLVDFPSSEESEYQEFIDRNIKEFENLAVGHFDVESISANFSEGSTKGNLLLRKKLETISFNDYSDVILDVSSLPKAVYFNIVKYVYDNVTDDHHTNVFVAASENVKIDESIQEARGDEVEPIIGFRADWDRTSTMNKNRVMICLLGEGKQDVLSYLFAKDNVSDVYPVLPFPSDNPRRNDDLLLEYSRFLNKEFRVEPQNIIYAHESNPFELYRILSRFKREYGATLQLIPEEVVYHVAILTSKLLSIGALLFGLENPEDVLIYNISAVDYTINNKENLFKLNGDSKPFLMWIKGEAYDK